MVRSSLRMRDSPALSFQSDKSAAKFNLQYQEMSLKAVNGSVITKVKMDGKDSYTFESGLKIAIQRNTENFDKKYTTISQGEVVDSEYIPLGATIYFNHNSTHEMYRIYNYKNISGEDIKSNVAYFSIPEDQCYLWRMGEGELQPLKNFVTAMRVFKPYHGILEGIDPTLLKNVLYITSGELKGNVCHTLKAADYQLTFLDIDGRDHSVIRVRHSEDHEFEREELVATNQDYTKKVEKGELYVGLTTTDCRPLKSLQNASAQNNR